MAQQFTLTLTNPDLSSAPLNQIYTDKTGGNRLDLTLTNNSGFDTSFSPASGELLIKIPANIIDADSAAKITVAAPWTTDGIYTPANDPIPGDKGAFYVVKLAAPDGAGVAFDDGTSVKISLAGIVPTAKGNATVVATYNFADLGIGMQSSAQLAVIGMPSPSNPPLIGDGNALALTLKVNDGPATNGIVVTASPVTAENAAENIIQILFDFQDQTKPGDSTLGKLVNGWDPLHPPTFQIQFPFFAGSSKFAAPYDLTDAYSQGDPNYNPYTSGWNIGLSLSKTDPNTLQNDWWIIIAPDPKADSPIWQVRPTAQNTYLFTGTTIGPNAPGPFLNLYFSHIYSDLPFDENNNQTILYMESTDFPGFNDRVMQLPLFKVHSVGITDFYGSIKTQGGITTLALNWHTDADHCLLSGDATQQTANSVGAYKRTIDLTNPLASSYTLTAVGNGGTSQLQRTIYVRWIQGALTSSTTFNVPSAIDISPDGKTIYVVGNGNVNALDSQTLNTTVTPLTVPDGTMPGQNTTIANMVPSPDGSRIYIADIPFAGGGELRAYTSTFQPLPNISVAQPGSNGSPDLYPMAISADGAQLVISMPFANNANGPAILGYNTANLNLTAGSPYKNQNLRGIGLAVSNGYVFYPDKNGLGVLDRTTLSPVAGSPVSLKSTDQLAYAPGPLAVSPDGNFVATLALGVLANRRVFVLCTVDVSDPANMKLSKRVEVTVGFSNAPPAPSTGIAYSADGQYLFAFGMDYSKTPPDTASTIFNVYDSSTLEELDFSPIPVTAFYGDIVMAPDGSRFYVSTYDTGTGTTGQVMTIVPVLPSS